MPTNILPTCANLYFEFRPIGRGAVSVTILRPNLLPANARHLHLHRRPPKGQVKMKPTLSPSDINFFKTLLQQELEALLTRADETVSYLTKMGETTADPLDRAAVDSGRESNLRFRERESRLIRKIKTALEKIEDETFGICESCGGDIPVPRLKARPVASHCIKCKTKMENWERVVGW